MSDARGTGATPGRFMLNEIVDGFRGEMRFLCPSEVLYRRGLIAELPAHLAKLGLRRLVLMTDRGVFSACASSIAERLAQAGFDVTICTDVCGEPRDDTIEPIVERVRAVAPDGLLAIGGGSVIDAAKLVAVVAAMPGASVGTFLKPATTPIEMHLPLVVVPTTAGPGAEVTRGVAIVDPIRGIKRGFSRGGCYPRLALLDPAVTDTLPRAVTASSGVDALCQAIEAYLSRTAFPIGDILSLVAASLIHDNLTASLETGAGAARDAMMLAACFAALSFSTGGGLTFAHAFSDIAGPRTGLPHGFAAALLLPGVVAMAEAAGSRRAAVLRHALGVENGSLLDAVRPLLRRAGAPHISAVLDRTDAYASALTTLGMADRDEGVSKADALRVVDLSFDAIP